MQATAVVTGGTGGLGPAIVKQLVGMGWRIVVPWMTNSKLTRIERSASVELIEADVSDPASVAHVARIATMDSQAPLRGLVNLVGGFSAPGLVHETSLDEFEQQLHVNLRTTFLVVHEMLPHLVAAGGGSIVCTGARAVSRPFPKAAGYIASKAAVAAFARAVAVEYAGVDVRCNVVLPSVVDTPDNRSAMPDADHSTWVKPSEIASLVAYLLSDESAATSGAEIPIYGQA